MKLYVLFYVNRERVIWQASGREPIDVGDLLTSSSHTCSLSQTRCLRLATAVSIFLLSCPVLIEWHASLPHKEQLTDLRNNTVYAFFKRSLLES